jgi:hypothetical protein
MLYFKLQFCFIPLGNRDPEHKLYAHNCVFAHVMINGTVMLFRSKSRLDEIKRLNKDRDHKYYIVTELWVIESVKMKSRQDERHYLL